MKSFNLRSLAAVVALLVTASACAQTSSSGSPAGSASASTSSSGDNVRRLRANGPPIGVQLWSFREAAKPDPIAMLKMTRGMGITHVETAGLYGMAPDALAKAFKDAGLQATSMHVSLDELKKAPQTVIAQAKALGARYVGIAWYPHQNGFDEADARQAITDFNAIGRTLKDAGLQFFYHNHGYEPAPFGDGTLLDLIIRETDPELVKFEMDVLWTWLPGADPVSLINKYPGRFKLMHIKDMRPGVPRGSLSGGIPDSLKSVIGQGQVNWAAVLKAAERDGFEHYYLEDETTAPVQNAPRSLAYLSALKY